jgi:hypothetical protein
MRTGKMVQLIRLQETPWANDTLLPKKDANLIQTGKTEQENIAHNAHPCATGRIKQHQNS